MLQPSFREGFAQLSSAGLSYDAWLLHTQITELTDLARAFPDTTIILDHFGGPLGIGPYAGKQAELFPQWKADIAELARCENVVAKLDHITIPIDIVDVFRPSNEALKIAEEAIKIGTRVFWLQYGIQNDEAKKIVELKNIFYVSNKCIKQEYQRLFLKVSPVFPALKK